MKTFIAILSTFILIGLTSCHTDSIPQSTSAPIANIYSRGESQAATIEAGSQALLNVRGMLDINNEIFTFDGNSWKNTTEFKWSDTEATTYMTAICPVYEDKAYTTENLYSNDKLEDVLIAKDTLSSKADINLQFKHLFSSLEVTIENSLLQKIERIEKALNDEKLPVYGEGLNIRDWLYVEDHCEAIDIILRDNLAQMEEKFKKNKFAYRQFLIFKSSAESEKTLSSIKSVLTTNVQIFLEDKIEDFVTPEIEYDEYGDSHIDESSMFNPTMLRERPTVLFLCVPENQSNYMMPITSVMYFQILNMNIAHPDGCPILCFFDEFPNAGSVLGIDTIISTCRSRRIGVSICTQGIEQLKQVYGENITATLLNNLKTLL